jgi:hypothetical protein
MNVHIDRFRHTLYPRSEKIARAAILANQRNGHQGTKAQRYTKSMMILYDRLLLRQRPNACLSSSFFEANAQRLIHVLRFSCDTLQQPKPLHG